MATGDTHLAISLSVPLALFAISTFYILMVHQVFAETHNSSFGIMPPYYLGPMGQYVHILQSVLFILETLLYRSTGSCSLHRKF